MIKHIITSYYSVLYKLKKTEKGSGNIPIDHTFATVAFANYIIDRCTQF